MGVYFNSRTTGPRDPITSSNQRLGSAFYRLSEEKQMEKLWLYVLSTPSGLELIYTKTRPKAPEKKPRGAANLQSSQKISISRSCETKLGCVLSFL